ncbi:hypothetical protein H257_04749 [Aphanomyces astaci]|uniref:Uncharacterized protein n=1 Tax=Aphanomyces astaci TaxID=112090 RepID=W4GUL2_APHAT|nr:hypothetical protein H257_04749 [Aphanomyces astaci]ETV83001.1 hypothetical protein H257_04749 [Aphanomyces astaci]|eukprot:XP_009827672.1 hypothetical protein H257_04749 [Aphanomyces astaci]
MRGVDYNCNTYSGNGNSDGCNRRKCLVSICNTAATTAGATTNATTTTATARGPATNDTANVTITTWVVTIEKHVVLACLLHSYTAPVEHKTLCVLFDMPPTTLSRVLLNAECALLRALKSMPEASIRFPDHATQLGRCLHCS